MWFCLKFFVIPLKNGIHYEYPGPQYALGRQKPDALLQLTAL